MLKVCCNKTLTNFEGYFIKVITNRYTNQKEIITRVSSCISTHTLHIKSKACNEE